jgi:cytochrome c oxidase assembly protein subunit 15
MTEPTSTSPASTPAGLHRFATFLAFFVVLLITAGALVTSKQAGLSVPDWPLSYGGINPPRWWQIENVRAEHGHRLIAGTVAMLTVLLAVWMHRREPRRWVRRLSLIAVAAVLSQALLGGLTVLFFLPTPVSVSHAGLAQLFLCLVVTMAVVTSASWPREPGWRNGHAVRLARWTTGCIYLQILLGAVMRHTDSGLAIPDFPLAFGKFIPPHWSFGIGIHFAHRLGALMVLTMIIATWVSARQTAWQHRSIRLPVMAMLVLVATQVTLGALVVLTGKAVFPNTVHVGVGATLLATSLVLSLNSWRLGSDETVAGLTGVEGVSV